MKIVLAHGWSDWLKFMGGAGHAHKSRNAGGRTDSCAGVFDFLGPGPDATQKVLETSFWI